MVVYQCLKTCGFFLTVCLIISVDCSLLHKKNSFENVGKSELFLTPLIEQGLLDKARKLSMVKPLLKNLSVESHSGYLTVDKNYNSNIFFWFFKCVTDWEKAPVTVWLQGGPGTSGIFGLLLEHGPYMLKSGELFPRDYSWHNLSNMIYIDNPVGTGFSFTELDGYTRNQTIIGEHLYSVVEQFLTLFPNLKNNKFFITGESYAGKYVPSLAYTIHKKNAEVNNSFKVNLQGLMIGNGLSDPVNMMKYGDYLYQTGLIDFEGLSLFHEYENKIVASVNEGNYDKATDLFGELVLGYRYSPHGTLLTNLTGIQEHFNFLNEHESGWSSNHTKFMNSEVFRRAVHVGNRQFSDGKAVAENLKQDIMKSVISKIVELLDQYRITFYNGQLDIICAYPLTVNFLQNMKWKHADSYKKAERMIWKNGDDVLGYYKVVNNLNEILMNISYSMCD
ncbi:hypothetical protein LSTR_LSTR011967 [Laodelphax striatellus]|uniref:Carboxypeptidase n=1 Tax=Laodelphax striatellus TaxID=195883 RepID=A0A482XH34_LAOST|nr:hypothetical protein LSTR_LSTR011967 [Laodelphax striatellus]